MSLILSDNDFIISDVKVEHVIPSFYTEGINFVGNALSRGLHRLNFECEVHFADENDIRKFQALMLRIGGRFSPFQFSLQDTTDGKGFFNPLSLESQARLSQDLTIGSKTMNLVGISGDIPEGTMFQFPNDTKVYTITLRSRNTAMFYPALRTNQVAGSELNFKPVPTVRLSEDKFRLAYEKGSSIGLKMVEAL